MAKVTNLGWAKPTDPVYKTGLIVSSRLLTPSTKDSQDSTVGQPRPPDLQNLPSDPALEPMQESAAASRAARKKRTPQK